MKQKFKDWIEDVVFLDDNQGFLLDGYQTGEIFEWHEWYMKGMSPEEATEKNYKLWLTSPGGINK